jgi:hypothetical protein
MTATKNRSNTMTEREFQDAVVDVAHTFGWSVFHARPAGTNKGWRTPIAYDGKGYPDLTLIHRCGHIVFAEIKREAGASTSAEQIEWGTLMTDCADAINRELRGTPRASYRLWRPRDGDEIVTLLSFGRVTEWTP